MFGKLYPKAAARGRDVVAVSRAQAPGRADAGRPSPGCRLFSTSGSPRQRRGGRPWPTRQWSPGRRPDADADRWLQGLAEACQAAGLADEARAYCKEAAERSKSAAAYLRLGDLHAEAKQFADAAAAYERAWRAETKQPLPLWLRGWALEKAGLPGGLEARGAGPRLAAGRRRRAAEVRRGVGEAVGIRAGVARRGPGGAAADPAAERPGGESRPQRRELLSSDAGAAPDRLAAADTTRRFLFRMLRTNAYFKKNQGYLLVLHREAASRAKGLLATGDVAGAVRMAEAAAAFLPGHTEPAASIVSELAKTGHAAEADRIYAATVAVQDRLCKDYPQSAEFRNTRAWLAVRCRRDLDLALDHARKAVELTPKSAGYRETLAEVLFQRGDRAAAVDEIKHCVELEPKSRYYAKQLKRMEAGDRAAAGCRSGRNSAFDA